MSKGARTVADLDRAVAILRTRDATRARAIKALRGDIDRIEALLDRAATVSPAPSTNSTPAIPAGGSDLASTALHRARLFCQRLFSRLSV